MEKHGTGIEQAASVALALERDIDTRLRQFMEALANIVDSPKALLILRNAALTLLELPEHTLDVEKVCELLTDDQVRAGVIKKLSEETPPYWSEQWNSLWEKDVDPLLSESQQRIVRRISLVTFWSKEWDGIPAEVRSHVAEAAKVMIGGRSVSFVKGVTKVEAVMSEDGEERLRRI